MSGNFLSFGIIASLTCHFLLGVLVVPVLKNIPVAEGGSTSVFLGAFLNELDLLPVVTTVKNTACDSALRFKDFSKYAYFNKESSAVVKPNVFFALPVSAVRVTVAKSEAKAASSTASITFGFADFSDYLYQADFSDLKKMALKEELSSYMDFRVFLSPKGEVKIIKKIIGSGDPAFDLYVMLKLKKAIFKPYPGQQEGWLNVRFKIK